MPITENTSSEEIAAARAIAENVLAQATDSANIIRVMHAAAVLTEHFPSHTLAVFFRNWDENEATLVQLLSASDDVDDLDLRDESVAGALSAEQLRAVGTADFAIRLIGSDNELGRHLTEGEEEHEGWYEFTLDLIPAEPELGVAAAETADLSAAPRAESENADEAITDDEQEPR